MSGRRRWFAGTWHRRFFGVLGLWTIPVALLALLLPVAIAGGFGMPGFLPGHSDDDGFGHHGGFKFDGTVWRPKKLPATKAVGAHLLQPKTSKHPKGYKPLDTYRAQPARWPKPGTAVVDLDAHGKTKPVKAGALPVWVAPADTAHGVDSVRVQAASHTQTLRTGANGMLLGITPSGTTSARGRVKVVIDYSAIARAYGGGYGSRLRLVQLPGCALTTPQKAECQKATPLKFTNRASAKQLTATVTMRSASGNDEGTDDSKSGNDKSSSQPTAGANPSQPAGDTDTAASPEPTQTTASPEPTQSTQSPKPTQSAHGPTTMSARTAPLSADAAAGTTALAVTSGTSGSQGDYGATELSAAGTWQASATGSFTYAYPISVPSAVGSNAPSVGLNYDSQTVDGETTARNSQASWVGDGWTYQVGSVERAYRKCGSLLDSSGDKIVNGSGDECWGGDNATLSFGSHSGTLVPDGVDSSVPGEIKQWRLQGDDGTLVQELSGADNGLHDGVYYRVLTTDGTAAYFGADHSPSGAGSATMPANPADSSTHSAWGVPVLHPRSTDPCHDDTKGKASQCDKPEGWRWNLDFVVSPAGFVQRYDYTTESNYYDLGGGQAAESSDPDDTGTLTSYTRGGALTLISYGYTLADEQAGRSPAAEVDFGLAQRCQTTSTFTDCSASNLKDSTATHWPDVPWDLHCDSTDKTKLPDGATTVPDDVCITSGPSFWTTTRLASITTKVHVKATDQLTAVDSYKLGHVYSDAGGTVDPVTGTTVDPKDAGMLQAVMWLQSIQHTGKDTYNNGNDDITLNQVSFTGTEIDNRVNDDSPSAPPLYRPRISSVQTETGESIAVEYNSAPCAGLTLSISQADSNTHSCYPVYWTVPGASKPITDWFNKVTVNSVAVSDLTIAGQYKPDAQNNPAGSEAQISRYSYSGPAWHRDDSAQTDDQYRTWDQFRGFRTVTVQTGQAPEPVTQQTTTYLQGMDGDYKADGTRRSVTVDAKVGGNTVLSVTDADQLAGTTLQDDTYTQAGGTVDAVSVNGPFTFTTTASANQTPWTDWTQEDNPGETKPPLSTLPDLTAYRLKSSSSMQYEHLANGTWRHTKADTAYDSQGRLSTVNEHGDGVDPDQEKCATTTYATPPSGNSMALAYPDQVTAVSGPCGTAPSATTLLSDRKLYYDGDGSLTNLGTFGQLEQTGSTAIGRVTAVRTATGYTGTTENWQTNSAMKYDGAGRITDTLDVTGQNTHTAFTPPWTSAGGNTNPTDITTTNSQNWTVTSSLDALRGLPTENVDANGRKTEMTYDALGRRTAVWLPGRDKAAGQSADRTFEYSINPGAVPAPGDTITQPGAPTSVTAKTLREDGTYATSITIYDGMLQPRQAQATAMGDSNSGRIISDTFYDSHGWQVAAYAPYSEPNNFPSTTLYAANENQIPSETTTTYDGQGRTLKQTLWHQAVEQWHTSTSYPGADEVDTTAPAGGRSTASFTNAIGQTTSTVVKNTGSTVTLPGGSVIPSGTSLTSNSVRLTMQADGNLVLSSLATGATIWSSATGGHPGAWAKFGTDGNLVIYSTAAAQLWTTGLTATTGATFQVRNDSTVAVVASGGAMPWKQGTAGNLPAADATTRYTYTPAGRVESIKDNAGNTWSYTYNLLGQKLTQTDPNTGTTTFDKYDVAGNLLQTTDARGQARSFTYDWDNRATAEYAAAWSATPDASKLLVSHVYDTLEKGYETSATRYVGGASGSAYTQAVTGYNTAYQPLGTTLTIPGTDGFAAAGQSSAPATGNVTYTSTARYTPNVGLLSTAHYQADGNLPAEDIDYGYTQQGNLDGIGGFINSANTPAYLDTAVHDAFGRVLQANYGPVGKELATFAQYDATTGRVTQNSSMVQTSATALDVVNLRYNQAGELTAIDDLQNNTTHDTQCFTYDSFQRLTAAWTDTAGITDPNAATPGAIGGCNTARVQTTTTAPIKTTTVGGPAPYWQTYTYDQLGDRTGMVNHDTTGNALSDTTQSVAYPGVNGTTPATLPDQAGTATLTNPAGTATTTSTYTDPAHGNVNAGDTISRKVTAVGPLTSSFTISGGGKRCVDDAGGSTTAGTKVQINTCNGATSEKWTIGTDGTVKVLGMCLDTTGNATTSGTLVVIDTCKTDATQKWKVTTTGTLVSNANSAMCLTDPGASATTGTQLTLATCGGSGQTWTNAQSGAVPAGQSQTFTYDAEGRTATVATTSGTHTNTSKYLYDAKGGLLEQTAAVDGVDKTRILYLFGGAEQITLNVAAKTWTGLRNITGPDGTTVTRSTTGTVTYQVPNGQGTALTAVDASTLAVTRRSYDPWGNTRGTKPSSWVAPDENHGFLGQPADPVTGLNLLGARNYDPVVGRFLTPDPLFEAGDPNQMGGYTYAGDDPASGSDPTGTIKINSDGTQCSGGWKKCGPGTGGGGGTSSHEGTTKTSSGNSGNTGGTGGGGCNQASKFGCDVSNAQHDTTPPPNAEQVVDVLGLSVVSFAIATSFSACEVDTAFWASPACIAGAGEAFTAACAGIMGDCGPGAGRPGEEAGQDSPRRAAAGETAGAETKAVNEAAADVADITAAKRANAQEQAVQAETEATRPSKPEAGNAGTKEARCSFSPETPVLMTGGRTKAIGKIKVGDKVESADQKTGKHVGARTVQHVWINHDHDLLDLTIRTKDGHAATIHTTANHPFWDDTTRTWVPAGKLHHGDNLNTPTGHDAYVVATHPTPGAANRWNLTVQQLHTYYVVADGTSILVHNTNCPTKSPDELRADAQALHDAGIRNIQDPPSTGNRKADQGITVATGQLGGRLVYAVSNNATTPEMRTLAQSLGYERIHGADYVTPGLETHAEQILFNAIEDGTLEGAGTIAPSRPACGPLRQDCAGRAVNFPGVNLTDQPRISPWDR
ncbi:ricin-type beta-trefoil lectin domain protein [Streptomyces olivochromogenes]|uniref:ricin-type beta-trefoil lectin domain protein n=1 Tax=Streptomyces olivochromogenes TaxID=1963 RepID=UPI001F40719C|nr:ricin-type beta-trefoil lectin domain protein [Streptomyces olivochromogenes]MCF3135571.1 ricin-type beta-trefoil lectin domain protein [Streptomyces olivochromogenes]